MTSPGTKPDPSAGALRAAAEHTRWICIICGWIYDESAGLPEDGIAPGTRFEDIPDDWRCPLCGVGKADFVRHAGGARLSRSAADAMAHDEVELGQLARSVLIIWVGWRPGFIPDEDHPGRVSGEQSGEHP